MDQGQGRWPAADSGAPQDRDPHRPTLAGSKSPWMATWCKQVVVIQVDPSAVEMPSPCLPS